MITDTERRRIADQAEQARLGLADTIRNARPGGHRYVRRADQEPARCPACRYTEAGVRVAADR